MHLIELYEQNKLLSDEFFETKKKRRTNAFMNALTQLQNQKLAEAEQLVTLLTIGIEKQKEKIEHLEEELEKPAKTAVVIDEKDTLKAQEGQIKAEIKHLDKLINDIQIKQKTQMKLSNVWETLIDHDFSKAKTPWIFIPDDLTQLPEYGDFQKDIPPEIITGSGSDKKGFNVLLKNAKHIKIDSDKYKGTIYHKNYSKLPKLQNIFDNIANQENIIADEEKKYTDDKKNKENELNKVINQLKTLSPTSSALPNTPSKSQKRKLARRKKKTT